MKNSGCGFFVFMWVVILLPVLLITTCTSEPRASLPYGEVDRTPIKAPPGPAIRVYGNEVCWYSGIDCLVNCVSNTAPAREISQMVEDNPAVDFDECREYLKR